MKCNSPFSVQSLHPPLALPALSRYNERIGGTPPDTIATFAKHCPVSGMMAHCSRNMSKKRGEERYEHERRLYQCGGYPSENIY